MKTNYPLVLFVHIFFMPYILQAQIVTKPPADTTDYKDKICLSCEGGGGGGGGGTVTCTSNTTIYVDASRPDNNGSGYTWATAKKTLHAALYIANRCTNIANVFVAKGVYKASNTTTPNAETRNNNFFIGESYNVFGGYPTGGGTRDWVNNPTVLDGEIVDQYEAYHVVSIYGVTGAVLIDGFQIKNGFADGTGSVELEPGITMSQDDGAGVYIKEASNVTIRNCVLYNNVANGNGGGIFTYHSTVALINTIAANNTSAVNGGGIILTATSSAYLISCTFYNNNNFAATGGAVYLNSGSYADVSTTIIWGNSSAFGGGGSRVANSCLVQGGVYIGTTGGTTYTNCLVADPLFNNTANLDGADNIWFSSDDGLSLPPCSPALNRGNNDANVYAKDISNASRIFNTVIDIGAYEEQSVPGVSAPANRSLDGDTTQTFIYGGTTALVADGNCRFLANITPSTPQPAVGRLIGKTYIETGMPAYNQQPYVTRHTDIKAFTFANTATATTTLWFGNGEFTNYNARADAVAKLPLTDGTGKQNLRIVQYRGTSATGLPGTYNGSYTLIDPDDVDIVWSAAALSWKISFNTVGYGGFFLTAIGKYRFTGNGNWSDVNQWQNNLKPPATLPSWCEISIAAGANCVLNVPQTISRDAKIVVETGANLQVNGNLTVLD